MGPFLVHQTVEERRLAITKPTNVNTNKLMEMSASPRLRKSGLKRLQPKTRLQEPCKTTQQEPGLVQSIKKYFERDCSEVNLPKTARRCLANSNDNLLFRPLPNHTEPNSMPLNQQMAVTNHQQLGDRSDRAAWPINSGTDGHLTDGRNTGPIGAGEEKVGPNLGNETT